MDAEQYATYRNEFASFINPGSLPFASADQLKKYAANSTDWQDALFRHAPVTNVNLSLAGGDDKSRYYLSGNYFSQDGIVLNSGYKKGALRFNFDRTISSKVKFNLTSTLTNSFNNRTLVNTAGGTAGGVIINMLRMNPTIPIYDANGKFIVQNYANIDANSDPLATVDLNGNPIAYAVENINGTHIMRNQINSSLTYQIIPSLQFKTLVGVEYINAWNNSYTPNDLFEQAFLNGTAVKSTNTRYNWINEDYLTYNKDFNPKNSLNVVAGVSYQFFKTESLGAMSTNYFTNAFTYNNLGTGTSETTTSSASQNQLLSAYTRLNAKLLANWLITGTLRVDGSSNFGDNHKYAYFPSAGIAYRLGQESFMQKVKFIDDLN